MATVNLITMTDPRAPAAEAFRTLRTNLIFSGVEQAIDTLMVTSVSQSEDKSIVLANLAVTFAQSNNKTIIVDSDLRRPNSARDLGHPQRAWADHHDPRRRGDGDAAAGADRNR